MGTNSESIRLIRINISEEHKAFFWTPAKTASVHATTVFTLFNFEAFTSSYDRSGVIHQQNTPYSGHNLDLFEGHENYILICTARNPITRVFSAYNYSNRNREKTVKGFREFFSNMANEPNPFWLMGSKNFKRVPDYFIRQEHMLEDYMKIPFIKESKIASSGALEEMCNKKMNTTKYGLDIKDGYTQDMIDYLYNEYRWYFDTLGYEPKI